MNKTIKLVIVIILLVGVIGGATLLYNKLGKDYERGNLSSSADTQSSESEEEIKAPDFTVLDYDGNEVKLSDYEGKPIVLNFWATWCYYCKEEMPDFDKASKSHPEVQFLMVNATDGYQETVEVAKQYVENEGYSFPVFFDTEQQAVDAYYINSFPSTFFIDAQGNLVTYANGMLSAENLEKGIEMITE